MTSPHPNPTVDEITWRELASPEWKPLPPRGPFVAVAGTLIASLGAAALAFFAVFWLTATAVSVTVGMSGDHGAGLMMGSLVGGFAGLVAAASAFVRVTIATQTATN